MDVGTWLGVEPGVAAGVVGVASGVAVGAGVAGVAGADGELDACGEIVVDVDGC